jgi:L-lactate dehydrogenase
MAVSTMLHGEYGLEDVCLSILNTIGSDGAIGKILYNLNSSELTKLHASADALRAVIKQLDI